MNEMGEYRAEDACRFHDQVVHRKHDAAYHDMASLFGFKGGSESHRYRCVISGKHDNNQCLEDFTAKLNHFFYGEHPTRKSYFNCEEKVSNTIPARTVYTGNYIFKPECLKYFIPFATLKLRMAGPVLGRIVKAEVGEAFVSANLPMLHRRTVEEIGQSEFRPGVENNAHSIDLSGEFERQFFGDVMLFSVGRLTEGGYPEKSFSKELILQIVENTESELRAEYADKQQLITKRLENLEAIINDDNQWWNQSGQSRVIRNNFQIFIDNIRNNYASDALSYQLIDSAENRAKRHQEIVDAISSYGNDRAVWEEVLA